jgi:hypothetical protein
VVTNIGHFCLKKWAFGQIFLGKKMFELLWVHKLAKKSGLLVKYFYKSGQRFLKIESPETLAALGVWGFRELLWVQFCPLSHFFSLLV